MNKERAKKNANSLHFLYFTRSLDYKSSCDNYCRRNIYRISGDSRSALATGVVGADLLLDACLTLFVGDGRANPATMSASNCWLIDAIVS